jgi:hypothetical protein
MNGASAMAANGIARYTLGAVFPLFTVQSKSRYSKESLESLKMCKLTLAPVYEALGVGWATSLLGFLALCMIPIPFLFHRFGHSIRVKSMYPTAM